MERPKNISIMIGERREKKGFGCVNMLLYSIYRLLKILFLSIWFYYLPLIFVIYAGYEPVREYR